MSNIAGQIGRLPKGGVIAAQGNSSYAPRKIEFGLYEKQREFIESKVLYTGYGGARGGGKALTVDTPICTPFGFRRMGDIEVGDTVIGKDGGHTKVIGVYPQGLQPTYKVTFIDGASVECTADHLWTAKRTLRHGGWKVYTTGQLIEILRSGGADSNILIPLCEPVKFTRGKSGGAIKPYTLGVLLGDGSLTAPYSVNFTTDDIELARLVEADGYTLSKHNVQKNMRFGIVKSPEISKYIKAQNLNCTAEHKFIPDGYKYAGVESRYEILRGLMDTDGYADERGHCEFCSISRQLAEDVQWLVRSLGGKATLREKDTFCYTQGYEKAGQKAYIVYIQTQDNSKLFKLTRKRERCVGKAYNGGVSELCRRIISIEPSGEADCQCIAVDNTDSLYVTQDFIVTHNTHALRVGAYIGALTYAGIKILIIRRTYNELRENHIEPMVKMVPQQLATYNGSIYLMRFENGSTIKFGHYNGDASELEYQGQEYDWIFMDEATQFTEHQFRVLGGCLRGVNEIPKHFYLTCNPGGIGHKWVKRLFIDGNFKTNCANPEENENPKDYKFIFALAEDNKLLVQSSPQYLQMLSSLPEKMRAAHRYGDWNAMSGAYFDEFNEAIHVVDSFPIPQEWRRYRAFDYGVRDMFACLWIAVDFKGRCYIYREFLMGEDLDVDGAHGLIVPDAAQAMKDNTLPNEHIDTTFAPPDMWMTQSIGGRCAAEEFMSNGIGIVKSNNNRVQGHMLIKQMLANMPETDKPESEWKPQLLIFKNCKHLIEDVAAIQIDDKNPNDCAKNPHDITHDVDALRYFCISRTMPAIVEMEQSRYHQSDDGEIVEEYDGYLAGGEMTKSYMNY